MGNFNNHRNPVTGKWQDSTLDMMAWRTSNIIKSGYGRYKGTNPAGIRLSSSSEGTYKSKEGYITKISRSTKYGRKEKVNEKNKEYQDFRRRTHTTTTDTAIGIEFKKREIEQGHAYTGRKKDSLKIGNNE